MAGTPRRILVATDGSLDAAFAGRAAADLARRTGAVLDLVHVWLPTFAVVDYYPAPPLAPVGRPTIQEVEEREARALLEREARRLGDDVTTHLCSGRPADEIVALAARLDADLVVIGSRGLGPVRRLVLGTVSEEVVRRAPCPVLVLRREAWPPARVVVGHDGSAEAVRAADLAARIGSLFGADGVLVRAAHGQPLGPYTPADGAIVEGAAALAPRADRMAALLGRRPAIRVAFGDPAALLLATAEEGDSPALIAVGSRGLGALRRRWLGSTSTKVLHAAHGPVLICGRGGADPR